MTENPNYSARTAKWLGILQLIIAFCCVIDGIVTESLGYCSISSWATPIWSGFPVRFRYFQSELCLGRVAIYNVYVEGAVFFGCHF